MRYWTWLPGAAVYCMQVILGRWNWFLTLCLGVFVRICIWWKPVEIKGSLILQELWSTDKDNGGNLHIIQQVAKGKKYWLQQAKNFKKKIKQTPPTFSSIVLFLPWLHLFKTDRFIQWGPFACLFSFTHMQILRHAWIAFSLGLFAGFMEKHLMGH